MKSPRNQTITLTNEESHDLLKYIDNEFILNKDQIICGDLYNVIDHIPDNYYNLIIIDPPYNLSKDFGTTKFASTDSDKYMGYLDTWMSKVCDKLKSDGSLYICCDWKCSAQVYQVLSKYLTIINRITWQRDKGRGAKSNWKNNMEDIWFAVKNPKNYYFNVDAVKVKRKVIAPYKVNGVPKDWEETDSGNFRITYPSNFWDDISIPFWSMPENTDHPTQKPEKLIAKLILASSKPEDYILDPFGGSGTTAVTAKKLGRHWTSIELNKEYCLWSIKRIMNADKNPHIQGYDNGVFLERNMK